jgi:hypothetical protein
MHPIAYAEALALVARLQQRIVDRLAPPTLRCPFTLDGGRRA